MGNIHDMYKLEDAEQILQSYQKSVGQYIFCRAREDWTTRLFVDGMCDATNLITKDGWWDVFTVVDRSKPQMRGLYICKILDYHFDKIGFINSKVEPVKAITDEDLASGNEFLRLFHMTEYFPEYYRLDLAKITRYNIDALYEAYDKEYQEYIRTRNITLRPTDRASKHHYFAKMIFEMLIMGGITIPRINELLRTMFPMEVLAEDIANRYETYYKENYPTFYGEIKRKQIPLWNRREVVYYLEDRSLQFGKMASSGKLEYVDDIIRQVELIREYYLKVREEEKKAKREARRKK